MQTMIYDAAVPGAIKLVPLLLEAADAQQSRVRAAHPDLPACLELLRGWNYQAEPDSDAMTFYHLWWRQLLDEYLPEFGREDALYAALEDNSPNAQESMLAAAANATRTMRNEFDFVHIPWGDMHRVRRGEREEPLRGAGSGDPIFMTAATPLAGEGSFAGYGFAYAMAVELGESPRVVSVSMFGQSENPESEHFDDQFDLVKERRFKTLYTRRDDVLRQAVRATGGRVLVQPLGAEGHFAVEAASRVSVALDTALEPPEALPDGLAAFTPFMTSRVQPAEVAMRRVVRLCVPPEAAAPESWPALGLYAHAPDQGWIALQATLDYATGCFEAAFDGDATFAVLGNPAHIRVPEPVPTEPEQITPPLLPGQEDREQVWHAEQQDAPKKFTVEVLDESTLPENRAAQAPATRPGPQIDPNRKPIFRLEPAGTAVPAEAPAAPPTPAEVPAPAAPPTPAEAPPAESMPAPAESVESDAVATPAPSPAEEAAGIEEEPGKKDDGPRIFNFEVLGGE
jgi:hypothetical protein